MLVERKLARPDDIKVLDKAAVRVKSQQRFTVGDKALAFNPQVYVQVMNYLRTCLMNSAGILPPKEGLTQPQLEAPAISKYLENLHASSGQNIVARLVEFSEKLVSAVQGIDEVRGLLQLVGCTSKFTASKLSGKIGWIKGLLDNTRDDVRDAVAELFALVVAEMNDEGFEKAVAELTRSFKEKSLELFAF